VWGALVDDLPALREYEHAMSVAVNAEYARMGAAVNDGDEVAFLPPVSGG
jgi:molybdopterin converting factor small subunit